MTSTRSLRLGALSSAAVVLVGVALAAAGPAHADASLQVVSSQLTTDSLGYQHIVGEIVNSGTSAAAAHVDVLYTSGGTPSGSDQGDAMLDSLAAGERAPYDVQVDPGIVWDDYQLTLTPTATPEPNHFFATTITSIAKDPGSTSKQINGSVRNDNTTPADDVTVVFTFYDAADKAVGGEAIGTQSASALQPGASDTFTETSNPDLPAWTRFAYVVESTSPAAKDPNAAPTPSPTNPPEITLNCNPTMTLSKKVVDVGRTTTVSISNGTPGSQITLEGYSRPSTTYAAIRNGVTVAANGTAQSFDVRPPTSARVRLSVLGCSKTGTEQVIQVTPGLGIAITRVGTRTYTFSGKIIPGKQNTGRAIGLYVGSTPVKKYTAKSAADGSYKATLTLPRGATRAYWATGANMTNLAGKSAVKSFTVS